MTADKWKEVDRYFSDHTLPPDPALEAAHRDSVAANLPAISVSANQGKLLQLLARIQGARQILEIGTLGGYSTIWLARALPSGGRLVTLEFDPKHADVARKNIERAGLSNVVELRLGKALDTLPQLQAEARGPFDFIFIDADKENTAEYFTWSLRLSRPGTVIVVDNVARKGAVVDAASDDPDVHGMRRFFEMVAKEPRVETAAIQTVGSKGYDGFAIAVVKDTGKGAAR